MFQLVPVFWLAAQERTCTTGEISITRQKQRIRRLSEDSLRLKPGELFLMNRAGLYLRMNGPSGSSGLSLNGAPASQTEVTWNGIPFNNALLGQADASLLSSQMLGQAVLQYGGRPESGACSSFGGSLSLGAEEIPEVNAAETGALAGSFQQFRQWIRTGFKTDRCTAILRGWNESAQWNFPFLVGTFQDTMKHAARRFSGTEGKVKIRLQKNRSLEAGIWSQQSFRELSGALFEEAPSSRQLDENHRFFLRLKNGKPEQPDDFTLGCSRDLLQYTDEKTGILHPAFLSGIFFHAGRSIRVKEQIFRVNAHSSLQNTVSGPERMRRQLQRAGILLNTDISLIQEKISLRPHLSIESWYFPEAVRNLAALLPGAELTMAAGSGNSFSLSFFRKMRAPGLNDLYWPGAGNPLLRPEKGYNARFDWHCSIQLGKNLNLSHHAGIYLTRISDYLLWQPRGLFWKPVNAGDALLRGICWTPVFTFKPAAGWHASLSLDGRLSKQELQSEQENRIFRQPLPYAAEFQSSARLEMGWKYLKSFVSMQQCSSRPAGPDAVNALPAVLLFDAGLETEIPAGVQVIRLFAGVNNAANRSYRSLPSSPMPGRGFHAGLSIKYQ